MKLFSIAEIAATLSTPAAAITYNFAFGTGTSFGGTFTDYAASGIMRYDTSSTDAYDILVSGNVETDGTLGYAVTPVPLPASAGFLPAGIGVRSAKREYDQNQL